MQYNHPSITITQPVPGQYVIQGHSPSSFLIPSEGHVCPPPVVHIGPEVPNEALVAILEARGFYAPVESVDELPVPGAVRKALNIPDAEKVTAETIDNAILKLREQYDAANALLEEASTPKGGRGGRKGGAE